MTYDYMTLFFMNFASDWYVAFIAMPNAPRSITQSEYQLNKNISFKLFYFKKILFYSHEN